MRIEPLALPGPLLISGEPAHDSRGSFRRIVDLAELAEHGGDPSVVQVSTATNTAAGTVRGMHYQLPPSDESKTLWCTSGSIFDVLVDVRPGSPTAGQWCSVELSEQEPTALHVPPGFAHGYQTLADDTSLIYLISRPYDPERARTLRWDDPTVGIPWPRPVTAISDRDREAPLWAAASF